MVGCEVERVGLGLMRFNAPYNAQVKLRELRFLNRQVILPDGAVGSCTRVMDRIIEKYKVVLNVNQ